jgi:hypothetical protein
MFLMLEMILIWCQFTELIPPLLIAREKTTDLHGWVFTTDYTDYTDE